MMGHTHALSGCAAWLAAQPILASSGHPLETTEIAAGTLICAGSALLPDIDHPSATIAHTYGPVTHVLSKAVHAIAGGHRHATHSLLFVVLAGGITEGIGLLSAAAVQVFVFLLIGLGLRGLGFGVPRKRLSSAVLNAMTTGAIIGGLAVLHVRFDWLGLAVAIGCIAHLVGDCITTEGCPLLWPYGGRFSLPLVPRTDGRMEHFVVTPLLILVSIGFGLHALGVDIPIPWQHPGGPNTPPAAQ